MRKNVFGVKNLSSIIYGIICLFPMFAILGRVIYTQSNPNAISNYSTTSNSVNNRTVVDDFSTVVGDTIYFTNMGCDYSTFTGSNNFYVNDLKLINGDGLSTSNVTILKTYSKFRIYFTNEYSEFYFYNDSSYSWGFRSNSSNPFIVRFVIETYQVNSDSNVRFNGFYTINNSYTLDNAFEYSISEFTKDNNFGEIDCFGWFTDVFLDSSNAKNMLYINFLNWYLNYTLFASCGYIMFLVIYWFINFVRRILDRSMYQEYGGF